jgi:hypothetical protein
MDRQPEGQTAAAKTAILEACHKVARFFVAASGESY